MPRDEELIGSYIFRDESPEIEMKFQDEIGEALSSLLTDRGIYQKTQVALMKIKDYLDSIEKSDSDIILKEFSKRPWVPVTSELQPQDHMRSEFMCGVGDSALDSPHDEMKLNFPLPAIKTYCKKCKDYHTFVSIGVIWADGFLNYYPKIQENTEQLFNFHYNCALCKDNVIAFLVKRQGFKLTLCGRSENVPINVSREIPKKLRAIVSDAIGAANENDVFAGFYHLRTFCEHYMKSCLSIPGQERITGDELSKKYSSSLDNRMSAGLPPMSVIYEKASKLMHERVGTRQEFDELLSDIEGHIAAKKLFQKYAGK
ncbi:hypothetical protein [Photobacterium sanguinicancri]|uniref:hypothetical protein n=1 Tax=Photobacterium sanguinicancri TaxID=875932 RepID=UPI0026E17D01|nr:hypothetical protein [Photobacterium sanguinicancri]MDO6501214.1 hypothetical protein [Photobacterium sanguinicancri]